MYLLGTGDGGIGVGTHRIVDIDVRHSVIAGAVQLVGAFLAERQHVCTFVIAPREVELSAQLMMNGAVEHGVHEGDYVVGYSILIHGSHLFRSLDVVSVVGADGVGACGGLWSGACCVVCKLTAQLGRRPRSYCCSGTGSSGR